MALYVDGLNGSDFGAGTQGDPLKTLSAALSFAGPSKQIFVRGNTSYALTGQTIGAADRVRITGTAADWSVDGTRVNCTTSSGSSAYALAVTGLGTIENLKITMDPLMSGVFDSSSYTGDFFLSNIEIVGGGVDHLLKSGGSWSSTPWFVYGCKVVGVDSLRDQWGNNRAIPYMTNCFVDGMELSASNSSNHRYIGCVLKNCNISGSNNNTNWEMIRCILDGCTVEIGDRSTSAHSARAVDCVFVNAPGYAITTQITAQEAVMLLQNCCFYNNTSGSLGPNISHVGTNIIFADPKFVDPDSDDYSLQPDSPLIGSGFALPYTQNIGPTMAAQGGSSGTGGTLAWAI